MTSNSNNFTDRVNRIQAQRNGRQSGMGFVVHSDGVVTALGQPSSRLRFGFPLKGLLLAFILAVLVKGYVMWALGIDVYTLEVASLLEGSNFERVAGHLMMPDAMTVWVVDRYDAIYAFIQAGLAAEPAAA